MNPFFLSEINATIYERILMNLYLNNEVLMELINLAHRAHYNPNILDGRTPRTVFPLSGSIENDLVYLHMLTETGSCITNERLLEYPVNSFRTRNLVAEAIESALDQALVFYDPFCEVLAVRIPESSHALVFTICKYEGVGTTTLFPLRDFPKETVSYGCTVTITLEPFDDEDL